MFKFVFVFQMGIVFDFGDEPKKMQLGTRIVFGNLDFIANRFGDLCLWEPEPTEQRSSSRSRSVLSPPDWRRLSMEDCSPSPVI
jgi:hypothetical protein